MASEGWARVGPRWGKGWAPEGGARASRTKSKRENPYTIHDQAAWKGGEGASRLEGHRGWGTRRR